MMPTGGGGTQRLTPSQGYNPAPQKQMNFRTKKEVDQHVESICRADITEKERSLRYFMIARAYASVKEFSLAKRFLQSYIDAHPTQPGLAEAYKVMGDILSSMNDFEAALDSYKKSNDINPSRVTLNRICDLLANGVGEKETVESRKEWLTKQKTASNTSVNEQRQQRRSFPQQEPNQHQLQHQPMLYYNQGVSPAYHFQTSSPAMPYHNGGSGGGGVDLNVNVQQRTPQRQSQSLRHSGQVTPKNLMNQLQGTPDLNSSLSAENDIQFKALQKEVNAVGAHVASRLDQMQQELNSSFEVQKSEVLRKSEEFYRQIEIKLDGVQSFLTTKIDKLHTQQVKELKDQVARLSDLINSLPEISSPVAATLKVSEPKKEDTVKLTQPPLSELFKNPEGTWTCNGCYLQNKPGDKKCPSCQALQPGIKPQEVEVPKPEYVPATLPPSLKSEKVDEPKISVPAFSFGLKPSVISSPGTKSQEFGMNLSKEKVSGDTPPSTETKPSTTFPVFSFGLNSGGFGDLAKQGNTSGFAFGKPTTTTANLLASPVLPMFGTPKGVDEVEGGGDDHVEEFVPTAEFTPVIPLPPLVETKKGDEDENVIFEVRAKLLRMHKDEKEGKVEWKERGVGNIKILQNKECPTKIRIVMWRDQIHKLACNHNITKDIKVNYYSNTDKYLMWSAMDFVEDEPLSQVFLCKFGKAEQCKEFKDHVDRLSELIISTTDEPSPSLPSASIVSNSKTEGTAKLTQPLLSELFKKPVGTWTCDGCYLENKPQDKKCPSCETLQPGIKAHEVEVPKPEYVPATLPPSLKSEKIEEPKPSVPAFSFGLKPSVISSPGTKSQEFGMNFSKEKGTSDTAPSTETKPSTTFPVFSFGMNSGGFGGFGDLAKQGNSSGFAFGKPTTTTANFLATPVLPMFGTPKGVVEVEGDGDDHVEEFVPTTEFTPVIPLPPLVETKKGDEDENVIFEVRAKLLRMHKDEKDGKVEWKERGVGNIKILQNKECPTKIRIVMWRDQIHKLACNHNITKDMKVNYYSNTDKYLMWSAMDFVEDEPLSQVFLCKFGKPEQCKEFKDHVDRLSELINNSVTDERSPSFVSPSEVSNSKTEGTAKLKQPLLSELFKKPVGTWTCDGCYLENKPEDKKCPSCETLQPGIKPEEVQVQVAKPEYVPQFIFGFKSPGAVIPSQVVSPCPVTCLGCIGCDPDNFDFAICENREVPKYPEQTMTPEEFKVHVGKDKLANFSFTEHFKSTEKLPSSSAPLSTPAPVPVFSSSFGGLSSFTPPGGVPVVQPTFGFSSNIPSFGTTSAAFQATVKNTTTKSTLQSNSSLLNTSIPAGRTEEDDYDDEEEDDDDEYEDDEPIFQAEGKLRCRKDGESAMSDLGYGLICVSYDTDIYCNRFTYLQESADVPAVDHIICADTQLNSEGELSFYWNALMEYDVGHLERMHLEVTFDNVETAENFLDRWSDSNVMAGDVKVTEAYLAE